MRNAVPGHGQEDYIGFGGVGIINVLGGNSGDEILEINKEEP